MKQSSSQVIRVFFAIDLPLTVKYEIEKIVAQLQKIHHRDSIRWSKSHNLHITLQFLAAIKSEDLPQLIANARSEIETLSIFNLELTQIELFPTHYLPRIISINLGPQELLADMSRRIGRGIVASGYEIESRPYRGHITIGRLNRIRKSFSLGEIILPKYAPIVVNEVILYKSEPSKGGSNYTALEKFRLIKK